jgi:hypothetical protein
MRYLNKRRQDGFWLDLTEPWEHWESFAGHVCLPCLLDCHKQYDIARQAVWGSIPDVFNLPSWAKLEAEKIPSSKYKPYSFLYLLRQFLDRHPSASFPMYVLTPAF